MCPLLSIIIPCYNTEQTLAETLESVVNQEYNDWEAIIVNDGSPDNLEEIALQWVERDKRFSYYKKENGGLGSARNYGVCKAKAKYVLPLDSDNKLALNFITKAINVLQKDDGIGVVYGDAMYFGEKEDIWIVGEFDKYKILKHNYIDACAVIRKTIFEDVTRYDTKLPYQGHEDWELWLAIISNAKYSFFYLPEICFYYRISNDSMIKRFSQKMIDENILYLNRKYADLYREAFIELLNKNERLQLELNKTVFHRIKRKLFKK